MSENYRTPYIKNFAEWAKYQNKLENKEERYKFHAGEVWWCSIGVNIGHETDGKNSLFERTVIILKKINQDLFWGIPTTSVEKYGNPEFSNLYFTLDVNGIKSHAILSQIRVFDQKRLRRQVMVIPEPIFNRLIFKWQRLCPKPI